MLSMKYLMLLFLIVLSVFGHTLRDNQNYDDSNKRMIYKTLELNPMVISDMNKLIYRFKRPSWNFARKVFFKKIANGSYV
jgi:hypothetical protein